MNILTFNYEYPPLGGGGGVVHELIAQELAKRHRVHVITSAFRGLPRREERGGVAIVRVPVLGRGDQSVASLASMLSFPLGAWVAAGRLLRRERIDVINTSSACMGETSTIPPSGSRRIASPHCERLCGGCSAARPPSSRSRRTRRRTRCGSMAFRGPST